MGKARIGKGCFKGGAQVMHTHGMSRLGANMQRYTVKTDVFDETLLITIDQNAVFTLAEDIVKADITNMTHFGLRFAGNGRNGNGFCLSPEHGAEQAGGNSQILEDHIFNAAGISQLQGDASVGTADDAIFNEDIAEQRFALAAKFDGGGGRSQGAVGHHDIFAGTILHSRCGILKHDAIVSALDVAAVDAHILTMVGINAIAIGHPQIVENANAADEHILAPHHMHRPKGAAAQRHIPQGEMPGVFYEHQRSAGIE